MMGAQVGNYSAYQLGIHNHLNDSMGGILNEYSRFGAFREAYRMGALAVHVNNDAAVSLAGPPGFNILKQFTVIAAQRGEYRISWEMKNADGMTPVHARFAVNDIDIPASDQAEAGAVYAGKTYNYDVDLAEGDRLQIVGDPQGDEIFIRNFRIYYDWCIKYFWDGSDGRVLVTPLTLVDATALDLIPDF